MNHGTLFHVCVSAKKGICKHEVPSAKVIVEYGIDGDAHAGPWHRQVSILAHPDIESMRAKGLQLKPGAFGENLVVNGIDTDDLGLGSRLRIGPVLLQITQIGKVCHTRCAIYYATGDCIMPRVGLFATALEGGTIAPGMPVELARSVSRRLTQAAVITVSDRCSNSVTIDTAGPAVARLLESALGAHIAWTATVPDEQQQIESVLKDFADRRVDLVLTVGGTGMAARDVTPEATRSVLERELPGLSEAMRATSARITHHALLSRAVAGTRRETLFINLPGSEKAAVENLGAIVAALPHAIKMLRSDTTHPEIDNSRLVALTSHTASDDDRVPAGILG